MDLFWVHENPAISQLVARQALEQLRGIERRVAEMRESEAREQLASGTWDPIVRDESFKHYTAVQKAHDRFASDIMETLAIGLNGAGFQAQLPEWYQRNRENLADLMDPLIPKEWKPEVNDLRPHGKVGYRNGREIVSTWMREALSVVGLPEDPQYARPTR